MKRKIKTAVIGTGNMGKNHIRVYSEISDLVAIADIREDIGKPMAQKYKTKFYTDYRKMLDKEKPDAVSIVVPTQFHKEVAIECLNRKVATLVEKPIAHTVADAEAILDSSFKNKTTLMVGHIERFNPAILKLKNMINKGKIGRIISMLAIRVGVSFPATKNNDVVVDLAVHDIDIFNFLLDSLPINKNSIKHKLFKHNIWDSASILLEYKNAACSIVTNWITPVKMRKLYVTGTDGFVELDYISQKIIVYGKHMKKKQEGDFYEFLSMYEQPKKEVFLSRKEPLKEELQFFLNSAAYNVKVDTSFALDALKIILT